MIGSLLDECCIYFKLYFMASKFLMVLTFLKTKVSLGFGILCFLPAFLVATNYTLNHFYVQGCYLYDSGFLAYLQTHSLSWPMTSFPFLPESVFFSIHIIPLFYILSYFHAFLNWLGIYIHNTVYFSLTLGVWLGMISVATYSLFVTQEENKRFWFFVVACVIGVCAGLNGITLASLGLPHFEFIIPGLLIVFFSFYVNGYNKTACFFLFLGLLAREDVGVHYFLFLFPLTVYLYNSQKIKNSDKHILFVGAVACFCLLYSTLAFLFQKMFYPEFSVAHSVYLGTPPFYHVTLSLLKERFVFYFQHRLYIVGPILIILIYSVLQKSIIMGVGILAAMPWLFFSWIAVGTNPGHLTSYYAFPLVVTLVWPVISYRLDLLYGLRTERSLLWRLVFPGIAIVSSTLLFPGTGHIHDSTPQDKIGFEWCGRISSTLKGLDDFLIANEAKITFASDDAFTCMRSEKKSLKPWWRGLELLDSEYNLIDTFIYLPDSRLQYVSVKNVLKRLKFPYYCRIEGTHFMVATRLDALEHCNPQPHPLDQ